MRLLAALVIVALILRRRRAIDPLAEDGVQSDPYLWERIA